MRYDTQAALYEKGSNNPRHFGEDVPDTFISNICGLLTGFDKSPYTSDNIDIAVNMSTYITPSPIDFNTNMYLMINDKRYDIIQVKPNRRNAQLIIRGV